MLKRAFVAVTLFFVATAFADAGINVRPEGDNKRVALVIGNDNYKELPRLKRATNDAREVGKAMEKIGFEVTPALNLGRADTLDAVNKLASSVFEGDTVFIFFAGQAFNAGGGDYVLPIDVPALSDMGSLVTASLSLEQIVAPIKARRPARVVLVVDGCRDNPFKDAAARGGLAPLSSTQTSDIWDGVFVLFSAGIGQVAMESLSSADTDPNSLFTRFFIKSVGKPGQTLNELTVDLRRNVTALAKDASVNQTPAYYDQLPDAYVLVPNK